MFTCTVTGPKAQVRIHHEVAYDRDEKTGLWVRRQEGEDELVWNIVTNAGRDRLHLQCYGTSGLGTNGQNFIALSDNAAAPAPADTSLTAELTGDGLDRIQGSVTHVAGTNTTQVQNVFTYLGVPAQGVQKSALFNLLSGGVMAHEVQFTQRTLNTSDTLTITYTVTMG
jgi:hypothetical protein